MVFARLSPVDRVTLSCAEERSTNHCRGVRSALRWSV